MPHCGPFASSSGNGHHYLGSSWQGIVLQLRPGSCGQAVRSEAAAVPGQALQHRGCADARRRRVRPALSPAAHASHAFAPTCVM